LLQAGRDTESLDGRGEASGERKNATVAAASLPVIAPAPAWTMNDVNGVAVNSDQFKARLSGDFWATWCPPAGGNPGYVDLVKKYGKTDS